MIRFSILLAGISLGIQCPAMEPLRFNRDIRPILSENCFYCHGQDPKTREADLRLDERDAAVADLGGYAAIVPGDPTASEIIVRLRSHDRSEVMPPPKANKTVTESQIAMVERWIAEGAPYEKHWAYITPERLPLPPVKQASWIRRPLDQWVLARLEQEGLSPAMEAAPETWLRRASMDLVGLPPSPEASAEFVRNVAQQGEAAYETAVQELLRSPHYGERQAMEWLDAARYADTHGFNNDSSREMWRWRDWVIEAFNRNLPYNQFVIEQLAGDLLPNATLDQQIATGFARNHVINSEGGIIDEEYRVEYVADRVRTMSTAWLGLTMECARCHDHKFDAISQRDYYSLFAFFNNVPEHGEDGRVANAVPMLAAPTAGQQKELAEQEERLRQLDEMLTHQPTTDWQAVADAVPADSSTKRLAALLPGTVAADDQVGNSWSLPTERADWSIGSEAMTLGGKEASTLAFWLQPDAENAQDVPLFSAFDHTGNPSDAQYGKGRELRLVGGELEWRNSDRYPVYAVVVRTEGAGIQAKEWRHVTMLHDGSRKASGVRFFIDGREVPTRVLYDGQHGVQTKRDWTVGRDNGAEKHLFSGRLDEVLWAKEILSVEEIWKLFLPQAKALLLTESASVPRDEWIRGMIQRNHPTTSATYAERELLWEKHLELQRSLPTSMVMVEMNPARPTHVLNRGMYDAPTERVQPAALESLLLPWPEGENRNRLGLARWLTDPQHPLTARVVMNRMWAHLFGTGLVKTLEDFGSQSEWPSHPELLDLLARDFIDGGWDYRAILQELVLSATYRQDSGRGSQLQAMDPENRLLARGPRVRLPAEVIRDQALAVAGLLQQQIGGPSVYPYQPDDLYQGMVVDAPYPSTRWEQSKGRDLYRRSLYTFWKRTVPHPVMLTLDAPDREFCTVRRSRTNTPLQALVLWNETGFLEAARMLGRRVWNEGGSDDVARIQRGMLLVTGRVAEEAELRVLIRTLEELRVQFTTAPEEAEALLKVGEAPQDATLPVVEQAAAMCVASMLLNLDETLSKN